MGTEPSTSGDQSRDSAQDSNEIQATGSDPAGRHRWLAALVIGLALAACAGAILMYFETPQYEASALLSINHVKPFVAFAPGGTDDESDRYIQSQLELLRSPVILQPVLSRPEIAALPELKDARDRAQYLRDRITIHQLGDSDLYAVAYKSMSSQAAANVVNAVIAEYLRNHAGDESQQTQLVIDILEEERRRRGLEVERLRRRLIDLSKEVTGKDPFGYGVPFGLDDPAKHVANLFDRLMEIELDRESVKARLKHLADLRAIKNEHDNASAGPEAQQVFVTEVLALQTATKNFETILEAIKQTDAKWTDNPVYVRLDKAVSGQRAEYDKIKKHLAELPPGPRFDRGETNAENAIDAEKLKLAELDAKRELLAQRFVETVKSLAVRPEKLIELEFARAELVREEKVFESIASRKLALQTELRAPSRVMLRQRANEPFEADVGIRSLKLAIVCAAALLVPFAIAIARPNLNRPALLQQPH